MDHDPVNGICQCVASCSPFQAPRIRACHREYRQQNAECHLGEDEEAGPYCSWQHGSNENFNGPVRQYVSKKRRMETVTDEELTMIEKSLYHRPRKRLGFKTPNVVFHASLNRVALRT